MEEVCRQWIKEEELFAIDKIEAITDEEWLMDASFDETTLSATEIDINNFEDFEAYFGEDNQFVTKELDLTNIDGKVDIFKQIESTSDKTNDELSCKLCQVEFTTISSLYRHFRTKKHQLLETALYEQPFDFPPIPELTNGFQIIQDGPFSFRIDNDLQHITEEPISNKKEKQDFKIREFFNIKSELTEMGDKKKCYQCKYCTKTYSTCSNLRRHENLHLPVDIYKCSYCPKQFKQKEYLKKHTTVHSLEIFKK